MPFENVRIRTEDGAEFGPVTWAQLLQWHGEGRVPPTATLIDLETGEEKPASEFAALTQRPVTPAEEATTVPPTPVPVGGGVVPGLSGGNSFTPPDTSLGSAFSYGWTAFQRRMGLAIGGFLLAMVLMAAASAIPFLNFITVIVVLPPLIGGMMRFGMNLVNDNNPEISDLFSGFSDFGRWMGVYWLLAAVILVLEIPLIITMIPVMMNPGTEPPPAFWIGYAITMVLILAAMTRLGFTYFRATDGDGALDAIRNSIRMTQGRWLQVLGVLIVTWLLSLVGALVCGIGLLFTGPLAFMVLACYYNAVKAETGMM